MFYVIICCTSSPIFIIVLRCFAYNSNSFESFEVNHLMYEIFSLSFTITFMSAGLYVYPDACWIGSNVGNSLSHICIVCIKWSWLFRYKNYISMLSLLPFYIIFTNSWKEICIYCLGINRNTVNNNVTSLHTKKARL